ncbi:MAG: glycosyltransferase family 2 protein [Anaerolineae bacterium]|nr:glycosyltransferase family 2 protein [Anaerolineae bacterium]
MDFSVVIPVLNERENVAKLLVALIDVFESLSGEYEIIFIDDGSIDGTFEVLTELYERCSQLKVLQFRRNFGKSAALAAGFAAAQGEIVFTMDGDLQDDPAEIPGFLEKLDQGYDLVSGWKYPRQDPLTKTLPSKFFNFVVRLTTGVRLHDFNCGFKAYRREVMQDIHLYGALHRYVPILAHQKGYRVAEMQVAHRPRVFGKSKFGAARFMRGALDLLTVLFLGEYRWRPLHLFGWPGIGCFGFGLLINCYLTILWVAGQGPIGNRPLLILGVLLMMVGVQFFSIGLLAEMFALATSKDTVPYSIRRRLE